MGTLENRQIGSDIYIKLPALMAQGQLDHDPSKPWTHVRLPKNLIPAGLGSLLGGAGPDPAAFIKLLTSVTSSVTTVGTESVRGQKSTHYRMTFDPAKLRKLGAQLGDCESDDEPPADADPPLNVWLDGQGRLTRMQLVTSAVAAGVQLGDTPMSSPSLTPSPSEKVPGSMTIEFYDYGTPVSIEAPPADQTETIDNAFGNVSNGCTSSSAGSSGAVPPS